MKQLVRILLLVAFTAAMSACSTHRSSSASSTAPSKHKPAMTVPLVDALAQTYADWQTFYAPFTVRCSEPMAMSMSGRATMVRGESVHLSMRMLGFEVASLFVTPDSCIFADKYHKVLVAEPLQAITLRTGLTLGDIQDILMGRAFYPGMGTLCLIERPDVLFSPEVSNDGSTTLLPRKIPGGVSWFYSVDPALLLSAIEVDPDGYPPLTATYADAAETPAGSVASQVTFSAKVGNRNVDASIRWDLNKARWNEQVSDPLLNFKGYRRVAASSLLEQITNL